MFFAFDPYNILWTFIVSFIIQALFFAFAASFKTDKVTDISYSLGFAVLTLVILFSNKAFALPQVLAAVFVVLWAARLGAYLLTRIIITKTDARFDDKRSNFVNLLGFWVLQALAVWLVLMPVSVLLSLKEIGPLHFVSILGALIWAIGFAIEILSDAQKFSFKNKKENAKRWIQSGLWKYSRHPNFFGEVLLWWGVFIFVLPYLSGALYITVVGPLSITILLLFVSGIPLLEKSADKKYGNDSEYQEYKKRTSIFLMLPQRKG